MGRRGRRRLVESGKVMMMMMIILVMMMMMMKMRMMLMKIRMMLMVTMNNSQNCWNCGRPAKETCSGCSQAR